MPSAAETNAIAGTFGSIIGYIGGEVAEPSVFERLLWPQRFYQHFSFSGLVQASFVLPMGGPLHKAALETLDAFRRKGLYRGRQQGHMLGTAFYSNTDLKYKLHEYKGVDRDEEVRNGFWALVIQRVRHYQPSAVSSCLDNTDEEKIGPEQILLRRTSQRVQHLKMWTVEDVESIAKDAVLVSEDRAGLGAVVSIVASESIAMACLLLIIFLEHEYLFAAYLCLPLALKLLAIPCSVQREQLSNEKLIKLGAESILVEINDYDNGFPIIQGEEAVVRQFFRHYGHPIRTGRKDRVKEVACMALVFGFVLNFPIGLLSMLWVSQTSQFIWLSYQMLTVVLMHISRVCGWDGPGRIEDLIAQRLAKGSKVYLKSNNGIVVGAELESHMVGRISHGRDKIREIVVEHTTQLKEKILMTGSGAL